MLCFRKKILKRIILLSLIFISLFNFSGCKKPKKYSDITSTTYEHILKEKGNTDNKYIVIIYSTTCSWCKELESYVLDYYKKTSTLTSRCSNNLPKLYVLCVDDVVNQGIKASNDDIYENFVGTTNYQDIKISAEPALIEVTDKTVTNLISSKTTRRPFTDIKNYLNKL